MEQQLSSGEIDLAIATPESCHAPLRTRHLFDENYVLVGRRGPPALNAALSMEEYREGGSDHLIKYPTLSLFFEQA